MFQEFMLMIVLPGKTPPYTLNAMTGWAVLVGGHPQGCVWRLPYCCLKVHPVGRAVVHLQIEDAVPAGAKVVVGHGHVVGAVDLEHLAVLVRVPTPPPCTTLPEIVQNPDTSLRWSRS